MFKRLKNLTNYIYGKYHELYYYVFVKRYFTTDSTKLKLKRKYDEIFEEEIILNITNETNNETDNETDNEIDNETNNKTDIPNTTECDILQKDIIVNHYKPKNSTRKNFKKSIQILKNKLETIYETNEDNSDNLKEDNSGNLKEDNSYNFINSQIYKKRKIC